MIDFQEVTLTKNAPDYDPFSIHDEWEAIIFDLMVAVYSGQQARIQSIIRRIPRERLRMALDEAFGLEATKVSIAVQRTFDQAVSAISENELGALGRLPQRPAALAGAIAEVSRLAATQFGEAMTATTVKNLYPMIEAWRNTTGATVGDLIERTRILWPGTRPKVAAYTETTRLVSFTRLETWKDIGVEMFDVQTREDSNVRPSHTEASRNGPYPLTRMDMLPPVNGDYSCRCTAVANLG